MGGEIEEIGVRLATKLGEKGIKSEINLKKKKKKVCPDLKLSAILTVR